MSLEMIHSDLIAKLSESSLYNYKNVLLSKFSSIFDGCLLHTALTEHVVETGDAKPVNLPPYHTSPTKKNVMKNRCNKC